LRPVVMCALRCVFRKVKIGKVTYEAVREPPHSQGAFPAEACLTKRTRGEKLVRLLNDKKRRNGSHEEGTAA